MPKTIKRILLPILSVLFAGCFALGLAACKQKDFAYTVEVYLETLESSSEEPQYERGEDIQGTAQKGETITIEAPAVNGFTPIEHENNVATATVGKGNFRFYYHRNSYTVSYDKNEPAGLHTDGAVENSEHKFGETVTLPSENTFTTDGALFAGYSLSLDGEVLSAGTTFTVEGETTVYAIWNRALRNRLGGEDTLYVYREIPGFGELIRGGQSFTGTVSENVFTYETDDGSHSCVIGTTSFAYALEAQEDVVYTLSYNIVDEANLFCIDQIIPTLDRSVTLTTDRYLNATLNENGTESEGELVRVGSAVLEKNEENTFPEYAFVVDGVEQFRLYFSEGTSGKVFFRRGGERGFGVGLKICFELPFETMLDFSLDGYGNVRLYSSGNGFVFVGEYAVSHVYEVRDEETGELHEEYVVSATIFTPESDQFDHMAVSFRLMPAAYSDTLAQSTLSDGTPIFELYESDKSYGIHTGRDERWGTGNTELELLLDGFGAFSDSAILRERISKRVWYRGTYTLTESIISLGNNYVVTLDGDGGNNISYRISGDNGTFAAYSGESLASYELLSFQDLYSPPGDSIIAIGSSFSDAYLYEKVNGLYQERASGSIAYQEYGEYFELYTFTAKDDPSVEPITFVMSLIYDTDRHSNVFARTDYKRIYTLISEGDEPNYEAWKEKDGNGVIWYEEGTELVIYFPDGVDGSVAFDCSGGLESTSDAFGSYYTLAWVDYNSGDNYGRQDRMLEVDGERGEFSFIQRVSLFAEEGGHVKSGDDPALVLDGNGRAIYTPDNVALDGTYTAETDPVYGTKYHFRTSDSASSQADFWFVLDEMFYSSATVEEMRTVFRVLNSSLNREFTGTGFTLTLDGYYHGTYSSGATYQGEYYYVGANGNPVVCFTAESGERFNFRISGTSADPLDNAYGTYSYNGSDVAFDGSGNATGALSGQYTVQSESGGRIVVRINSETYVLGGGTVRVYRVLFDGTFVCPDGGVLVSDGASSFVWHNSVGERLEGTLIRFDGDDEATVRFGEKTYDIAATGDTCEFYE